jgi:hypothetical protein
VSGITTIPKTDGDVYENEVAARCGLQVEQVKMFSVEPPFYRDHASALAALGDVSDTRSIQVKVVTDAP